MPLYVAILLLLVASGCASHPATVTTAVTKPVATQPSNLYEKEFIGELVSFRDPGKRLMTWQLGFRDVNSGQFLIAEVRPEHPFLRDGLGLTTHDAALAFQRTQVPFRAARFRLKIGAPQGTWGGHLLQWERLPAGA